MSLSGNLYVASEMAALLQFMESIADRPAAEQLVLIRERVERIQKAADSGWL
jgi:hypothetical protein